MTEGGLQLDRVQLEDFASRVGASFELRAESAALVLREARAVGQGHPGRAVPFSLLFDGPIEVPLPQGTHALESAGLGQFELFLVPVGITTEARQYEAIFN
ncbi:MAG: hypothetical protein IT363_05480 [Methanoregulaceae archaeon]|nr:hypothetical protein [Methanoregulaceae archaeon]